MSDDNDKFISKIGLDDEEAKSFQDEFSDDLSISGVENVVNLHKDEDEDDPFNLESIEEEANLRMGIDVDEMLFVDGFDSQEYTDGQELDNDDSASSADTDSGEDNSVTDEEPLAELNEPVEHQTEPAENDDIPQQTDDDDNDQQSISDDTPVENEYDPEQNQGFFQSRKNRIVVGAFVAFMVLVIGLITWSITAKRSSIDELRAEAERQQPSNNSPDTDDVAPMDDKETVSVEASQSSMQPFAQQSTQVSQPVVNAPQEMPVLQNAIPEPASNAAKFGVPPEMVPDSVVSKKIIEDASTNWDGNTPISLPEFESIRKKTLALEDRLSKLSNENTTLGRSVSRLERSTNDSFESLMRQLALIQDSMAKLEDKFEKSTATVDDVIGNRIRLGQFNVININNKGIVTAHAPNGKRISLRQGEMIYIGNERLTVSQVLAAYDVVLIGDKWFIDIRREPIGSEERLLRKEIASTQIEPKSQVFTSVGDGPSQLSYSNSYEIRANVGNKVLLFNCSNQSEKIFTISETIPGHGAIRSIRANEVVTDKYVVTYDACVSTGG
tara:strand:+ start:2699 stop:4363 length:1665 start_codon:yes stop_codon:yes gene_type:complete